MDWYGWMIIAVMFIIVIVGMILVFVYGWKHNDGSAIEVHIMNPNVSPSTIKCVEHDYDFKPMEPDKFPFLG